MGVYKFGRFLLRNYFRTENFHLERATRFTRKGYHMEIVDLVSDSFLLFFLHDEVDITTT